MSFSGGLRPTEPRRGRRRAAARPLQRLVSWCHALAVTAATWSARQASRAQPRHRPQHGQQPTRPRSAGVEPASAAARRARTLATTPRRGRQQRPTPRRRSTRRGRLLGDAARLMPGIEARGAMAHDRPRLPAWHSQLTHCRSAAGCGPSSHDVDGAAPQPVRCNDWLGGDTHGPPRRPPGEPETRVGLNCASARSMATSLPDLDAQVLRPRAPRRA